MKCPAVILHPILCRVAISVSLSRISPAPELLADLPGGETYLRLDFSAKIFTAYVLYLTLMGGTGSILAEISLPNLIPELSKNVFSA